jgi:hypothetical protein
MAKKPGKKLHAATSIPAKKSLKLASNHNEIQLS